MICLSSIGCCCANYYLTGLKGGYILPLSIGKFYPACRRGYHGLRGDGWDPFHTLVYKTLSGLCERVRGAKALSLGRVRGEVSRM